MYKNDQELLSALKLGEQSAYAHLYREYFNMIRYMVLQNSGNDEQASDIFQDGVIVLFEKVNSRGFSLSASVKTYLYSICRNLWLKHLRDHKPTAQLKDFETTVKVDFEEDEEQSEYQERVLKECLEKLGDPCRALLTQFYYFKKSMTEIAEALGYTNADNAKNQKYRCIKRLRKMALAHL